MLAVEHWPVYSPKWPHQLLYSRQDILYSRQDNKVWSLHMCACSWALTSVQPKVATPTTVQQTRHTVQQTRQQGVKFTHVCLQLSTDQRTAQSGHTNYCTADKTYCTADKTTRCEVYTCVLAVEHWPAYSPKWPHQLLYSRQDILYSRQDNKVWSLHMCACSWALTSVQPKVATPTTVQQTRHTVQQTRQQGVKFTHVCLQLSTDQCTAQSGHTNYCTADKTRCEVYTCVLAVEHWPVYSPKWPHQLLYSRQDNKVWSLHMCACSWALTSVQPKVATPTTVQQTRQQGVKFTHVCLQLSTDQCTAQSGHTNYCTADKTRCEVYTCVLAVEHWPVYSPKWPHQLLYSRQDNKVWSLHMCACSWALTSVQPKVATPTTVQQTRQQGVKFTHVCLQLSTDQCTAQSGHTNYCTADKTTRCEVYTCVLAVEHWPAYSPKWPHQLLYSRQDNKVWSLHMCACSWALTSVQPKVATPTTVQQTRQQGVKFTHVCLQLSTDQCTAQSGHTNYCTADKTTRCEVYTCACSWALTSVQPKVATPTAVQQTRQQGVKFTHVCLQLSTDQCTAQSGHTNYCTADKTYCTADKTTRCEVYTCVLAVEHWPVYSPKWPHQLLYSRQDNKVWSLHMCACSWALTSVQPKAVTPTTAQRTRQQGVRFITQCYHHLPGRSPAGETQFGDGQCLCGQRGVGAQCKHPSGTAPVKTCGL